MSRKLNVSVVQPENCFPPPPKPLSPINSPIPPTVSESSKNLQIDYIQGLDVYVNTRVNEENYVLEDEIAVLKEVAMKQRTEIQELKEQLRDVQFTLARLKDEIENALSACS